jgi:hypothetical protein
MASNFNSKERWDREKATEREYAITPGSQKGELLKEPPTKAELKTRAQEMRAKQAKYKRAVQAQDQRIAENYYALNGHLEELASGALVTTEDGLPQYVAVDKPEAPEAERLEAEYEKARRQEDPVTMSRIKTRLAEVKAMDSEYESARVREMEQALGMPDAVSYAEGRETIEEEIDEDDAVWTVTDIYGEEHEFDTEEEAQDFIDSDTDEIGDWTAEVRSRSGENEDDE